MTDSATLKIETLYQAQAQESLANIAFDKEQWPQCETLLLNALEKRRAALGEADASSGGILDKLGQTYMALNQVELAAGTYAAATSLLEKAFYAGHASLAPVLEHSGDCFIFQGKFAEAELVIKRALEINEKALANEHRSTLRCALKLAAIYSKLDRAKEAETVLLKSIKVVDTPLGPIEEFRYQLALCYLQQGKINEALEQLPLAINVFLQRHNYGRLAGCFASYGEALAASSRSDEAITATASSARYKELAGSHPYLHDIYPATYLRA